MKPTLLVLAAGIGNRYGGLKQIDPIGPSGETFIDYSIFDALRAGFGKAVFVIRKSIEQPFRESIGRRFEKRLEIGYAFQELDALPPGFLPPEGRSKPWGTAHAILMGAGLVREPFAVLNGDDFYGKNSFQALGEFLRRGGAPEDYAMVGFRLRNTLSEHGSVSRGVCRFGDGDLLRDVVERTEVAREGDGASFVEKGGERGRLTGDELVSMNMWGFAPSLFDHLRSQFAEFLAQRGADLKAEFFIPSVVTRLIEAGRARVQVLKTPDTCFGVTYKEDKPLVAAKVRRLIEQGVYPERLWA